MNELVTPTGSVSTAGLRFWDGLSTLPGAIRFLLSHPRTWPAAVVPALVLLALGASAVAAALVWVRPAVVSIWAEPSSWLLRVGTSALGWLTAALAATLGVLVALALTPPLSGPALESIVHAREVQLGVPERERLTLLAEVWCGIKAQLLAWCVGGPILLGLWLVELVFPVVAVFTVVAKVVVVSLGVAWGLLDYPLTLRNVGLRDRLALLGRNKGAAFGFGVGFAVAFWAPCCSVLMLPVGVAAATELCWRILPARPGELERAAGTGRSVPAV